LSLDLWVLICPRKAPNFGHGDSYFVQGMSHRDRKLRANNSSHSKQPVLLEGICFVGSDFSHLVICSTQAMPRISSRSSAILISNLFLSRMTDTTIKTDVLAGKRSLFLNLLGLPPEKWNDLHTTATENVELPCQKDLVLSQDIRSLCFSLIPVGV